MKNYIFLTTEGLTFQPDSQSDMPDIDNVQVIGFAQGETPGEAFQQLLKENRYLLDTSFDEIYSYQLAGDYQKTRQYFYLSSLKNTDEK